MTLDVETVVAVSLMMAVFSAVAAVGSSLVLGVGYERLRTSFDIVRKQTGFFSDAINKLEKKVESVDKQADTFSHSIHTLEAQIANVGAQAGAFITSVEKLEKKVEIVDRQTGFFSDALHRLETKIEEVDVPTAHPAEAEKAPDMISAGKDDLARAEDLLIDMSALGGAIYGASSDANPAGQELSFHLPQDLSFNMLQGDARSTRYH